MRAFVLIVILGCTPGPLPAADASDRTTTPVADALGWYSVWWGLNPSTPGVQTCRGELRENLYRFRCDPLSVVVDGVVDDSGHCSIVFMRASSNPEDGLRAQTFAHVTPPRRNKLAQPGDCGELPRNDGVFELAITPRSRQVNSVLTSDAHNAALAYNSHGGDRLCLLRFPNVKTGDPFFHVYEECQGVLDIVLEFRIRNGRVADFPHWHYSRRQGGLPTGWQWRRNRSELWFDPVPKSGTWEHDERPWP